MNLIANGGFDGDLSSWNSVGGAAYAAGVGHDMRGAARLAVVADAINQSFTVPVSRDQMVDVWAKGDGVGLVAVSIVNIDGVAVYTNAAAAVTTDWTNVIGARVGLPAGTYTLAVTYNDTPVTIDDVSVAWVIRTRLELAEETADILGDLATSDAGYTTTPAGDDTEGDYTEAVSYGLRQVGAIGNAGETDVRMLDEHTVDACIDDIQRRMLHKLHRYYVRHATDFQLEGRVEHYHQRVDGIEKLLGIAIGGRSSASGRGVKMGNLCHWSRLG